MVSRLFLGYAVVELTVVFALASTIGLGRTLLVLLVTFVLGVVVAGSQAKRQLLRLRSGSATGRVAVTEGALTALAAVLVVVPGLVSSVVGLLLLLPPVRAAARPLLLAAAARRTGRPLITLATRSARNRAAGDYIDGEVVDVTDVHDVTDVTDVTDVSDVTNVEWPALPGRPESIHG